MTFRIFSIIAALTLYVRATAQTSTYDVWFSAVDDSDMEWTSSPKWSCFESSEVKIECAEYDSDIRTPSISVSQNGHDMFFDVHIDEHLDCIKTLKDWEKILVNGNQICIYSAEVPTSTPEDLTLSYLSTIETSFGKWTVHPIDQ